jgi:hypothetical protein
VTVIVIMTGGGGGSGSAGSTGIGSAGSAGSTGVAGSGAATTGAGSCAVVGVPPQAAVPSMAPADTTVLQMIDVERPALPMAE